MNMDVTKVTTESSRVHAGYLLLALQAHITWPAHKATQVAIFRLRSKWIELEHISLILCHCEKVPAKVTRRRERQASSHEATHSPSLSLPVTEQLTHSLITRMSPPTRWFLGVEGNRGLATRVFLAGSTLCAVLDLGFLAGIFFFSSPLFSSDFS